MTKLTLTEYESEALSTALQKYIGIVEDQIKEIKKSKYASKKEIQRNLTKRVNLLKDILEKLK